MCIVDAVVAPSLFVPGRYKTHQIKGDYTHTHTTFLYNRFPVWKIIRNSFSLFSLAPCDCVCVLALESGTSPFVLLSAPSLIKIIFSLFSLFGTPPLACCRLGQKDKKGLSIDSCIPIYPQHLSACYAFPHIVLYSPALLITGNYITLRPVFFFFVLFFS